MPSPSFLRARWPTTTGFQYLRDNDPDNMGHNTSFLTRIANNVIYILNDASSHS